MPSVLPRPRWALTPEPLARPRRSQSQRFRDATPLVGRDGTANSLQTNIISLNAGESADAIFTAPAYQGPGAYDSYLLYNRSYSMDSNLSGGFGGQMTEVRVYPANSLAAQSLPNT